MIYETWELILMGVCLASLAVFVIYKIKHWRRMNGIIKDFNSHRFDKDMGLRLIKMHYKNKNKHDRECEFFK